MAVVVSRWAAGRHQENGAGMPERSEFRMPGQHRISGVVATAVALVAAGGCSSSPSTPPGEAKPEASPKARTTSSSPAPATTTTGATPSKAPQNSTWYTIDYASASSYTLVLSKDGTLFSLQRPRTAVGDDAPSGCTGAFTLKGGGGATTADVEAGKPLTLRLDCIDQVVVNDRYPEHKFTGTMTATVSDGTVGPTGTPLRKIVWNHGRTDYLNQS
ncbi:hypothetical protein QQY66_23575 [Streptomyces sp. DG2A-72]|uniref:hypothetical protein n=1 Tax=Streptomyces sp. DG2A-72 TaxID=3051386 RepID=UPI00265BD239|nr:hypothetical protein [Streptomyces sp. DG2A-72]MDO0934513.1 hypothetical protein [Streptomyces sp. DG2A-72]